MSRSNLPVVPYARTVLDTLKLEITSRLSDETDSVGTMSANTMMETSAELGTRPSGSVSFAEASRNGYYGFVTSRECGVIGGHMTRKLVADSETDF